MSIKELINNIEEAEDIVKEMYTLSKTQGQSTVENNLLDKNIEAKKKQLIALINSVPHLLEDVSTIQKIPSEQTKKNKLVKLSYDKRGINKNKRVEVTLKDEDRKGFVKSSSFLESTIDKIKSLFKEDKSEFRKPSQIARVSSKLFFETSNSIVKKGYFKKLNSDLRKANIRFLLNTYISIMLFFTLISFFLACFVFVFLLFFNLSLTSPFITTVEENIFLRGLKIIWVLFALPLFTLIMFYVYPASEGKTISKKIEQELPFVVINMSAISSSGIEPSKIFGIINKSSKEYPHTAEELKKVINYINVYGYDLSTALKISAEKTSSKNLRELFTGLASAIATGTSLTNFLDKRSETLLFNYKLERERYTKIAETFMNLYISIVIAAPLVLMLTFFLMSLGGLGVGISLNMISLLIVLSVILINIFFLIFLQLKQPKY